MANIVVEATGAPITSANGSALTTDTGGPFGYLAEGARTNLALWSRDLTNAAWTASNVTTALTATGADGAANSATTLTATGANGTVLQSITSASAVRVTGCYIKRRTGTGTINMTQDNGSTWTAVTVTSSWTAVSIPSATVTNPIIGFRIVTNADAIDVDYVMHEGAGATFMSSAIATTTVAVTRNADFLRYVIAANIDNTAGTMVAGVRNINTAENARYIADASAGTGGLFSTALQPRIADGTTFATSGLANFTSGVMGTVGCVWSGSTMKAFGNGVVGSSQSFDGSMGFATTIAIGCYGASGGLESLYGTVRNARIFKSALTDAQLAAL